MRWYTLCRQSKTKYLFLHLIFTLKINPEECQKSMEARQKPHSIQSYLSNVTIVFTYQLYLSIKSLIRNASSDKKYFLFWAGQSQLHQHHRHHHHTCNVMKRSWELALLQKKNHFKDESYNIWTLTELENLRRWKKRGRKLIINMGFSNL